MGTTATSTWHSTCTQTYKMNNTESDPDGPCGLLGVVACPWGFLRGDNYTVQSGCWGRGRLCVWGGGSPREDSAFLLILL